jgi:hypothetical protein
VCVECRSTGYQRDDKEVGTMKRPKVVNEVEQAIDEHTAPEHARPYAARDGVPTTAELVGEQQAEMDDVAVGPGVPAMTRGMWHGLLYGSLIGGAIGALVLLPFGFIPMGGIALGWRLLIVASIGAIAGGTGVAMYLGGRLPELEGETVNADGSPGVGSTPRDPTTDPRGRATSQ